MRGAFTIHVETIYLCALGYVILCRNSVEYRGIY